MNTKLKKSIVLSMVGGFAIQLAACGTILHPERKGQRAGRLDTGIVALNAVGLLFFLVPGVIAFAVDFNNGTIYLPGGSASLDSGELNVVKIEGDVTNAKIEQVIHAETGMAVSLDENSVHPNGKTTTISALPSEVRFL